MELTCKDCLSSVLGEHECCPNCGGTNVRLAAEEDTALRKAKGEALAASLPVRTPKRGTES